MTKPLFSIIIPVYKTEAYLDKCVQSVINQTFSEIEIILVDDGSPDDCPQMCDSYARQDPRIRVIHKENGGLSDARNAGVAAAQGNYVMFLDSDDYIAANACEELVQFANMDCEILICDGVAEGSHRKLMHVPADTKQVLTGLQYLEFALKRGVMPMAAVLYVYKRSFLAEHGLSFKPGITHEDEHFTPRAFLVAKTVVYTAVCFYRYVIRQDSITTQADLRRNAEDLYSTCCELLELYRWLESKELQDLLVDSLAVKYLSLFQAGRLYQYGNRYLHKDFVWNHAKKRKTRLKASLYCLSPWLYWHVNDISKRL